jgi:hypothetical protein
MLRAPRADLKPGDWPLNTVPSRHENAKNHGALDTAGEAQRLQSKAVHVWNGFRVTHMSKIGSRKQRSSHHHLFMISPQ